MQSIEKTSIPITTHPVSYNNIPTLDNTQLTQDKAQPL